MRGDRRTDERTDNDPYQNVTEDTVAPYKALAKNKPKKVIHVSCPLGTTNPLIRA